MLALSNTRNYVASISVSVSYSQSNLIIPELDTDPAILKVCVSLSLSGVTFDKTLSRLTGHSRR